MSQEAFCGNLQGKWPRTPPRPAFCASLRSRNAHGHVTRGILYGNLQRKCQTPLDWTPGLNCYRKNPSVWPHCLGNYSQAWGYRMRLLSSIFSQNGLSYKMPIHLQQPWYRRIFPLLQNAPSFSTTAHTRTYPLLQNAHVVFKNCTCKGTSSLQNATLVSTRLASTNIHQAFATKCPFDFDEPLWSSCFLTKCNCDFHDGLTWLKRILYKMWFTSLSYKILDLDFMSRLAWLKWKPLQEAQGHKLCSLNL